MHIQKQKYLLKMLILYVSNNIIYMLNYAYFEKLAISGDSGKSEVIRMYFTKLREFITDNQHVIYTRIL